MTLATLLVLAVALAADAFSLSVGIGLAGIRLRQIALVSFTVLAFHIVMPLAGWFIGEFAGGLIGRTAVIAGALLLVYLGGRMVWTAWREKDTPGRQARLVKFSAGGLILLGASVSMDALSVGFTLGTRQVDLLLAAGVIGAVAGLLTAVGLFFGRYLGGWVGQKSQLAGGLILMAIGFRLFF